MLDVVLCHEIKRALWLQVFVIHELLDFLQFLFLRHFFRIDNRNLLSRSLLGDLNIDRFLQLLLERENKALLVVLESTIENQHFCIGV